MAFHFIEHDFFPMCLALPCAYKGWKPLKKKKKYTEWNSGWALVISDSNKTMSEKGFFVAFYFFLFFSELQLRGGKWEDNVPPNAWLTVTGPGSVSTAEVVLFGEHCFHFRRKKKKKKEMSNPRRKGTECLLKLHHEEIAIVKGCCIVLAFLRNLKIYPEF